MYARALSEREYKPRPCNVDLYAIWILFRTGHAIEENAFLFARAQSRNVFVVLPPAEQRPGMIIMSAAILFSPEEGTMARPTPFALTPSGCTSEWPRITVVQGRQPQGPSMDTCPQPVINFSDGQAEGIIVVMHGI